MARQKSGEPIFNKKPIIYVIVLISKKGTSVQRVG